MAPKASPPLNTTPAPEASGAFLWAHLARLARVRRALKKANGVSVRAFLLASGLAAGSLQAQSLSSTEISTGAAAVAVLAQKCAPSAAAQYRQAARARLEQLSASLVDPAERRFAMESFETKAKALAISSQHENCASAHRLRQFARQWGFAHFIE